MKKGKRKGKQRIIIAVVIIALIIIDASLMLLSKGSSGKEWTIGYEKDVNGPVAEKQGENGWYFMYSEDINKKGKVDVSTFKDCVWSEKGSCWFFYEVKGMWMPEAFATDGYDASKNENWWLFDNEGHMNCSAKETYSSALVWDAQLNGDYTIDVEYEGGSNSYEWEGKTYYLSEKDGGDGLYLTLNVNGKDVEKKYCKLVTKKNKELDKGTMTTSVTLKKGDRIYLCEDPGQSANGDTVTYKAKITLDKAGFNLNFNTNALIVALAFIAVTIGFIISYVYKRQ